MEITYNGSDELEKIDGNGPIGQIDGNGPIIRKHK
jgi:hypothetical protein